MPGDASSEGAAAAHAEPIRSRTIRELEQFLAERDEAFRGERAQRLAEVMLLGEPSDGRMIFGSGQDALIEAQWSYIDGHFLSAILAVQVCLEKSLSGLIELADLGRPKRSYAEMLKDACAQRIISEEERDLFDRLRRLRNPAAHYRGPNHPDHPMRRALFEGDDPYALLEQDARMAVRALVGLMNRHPFALGPVTMPFSAEDLLPPVNPHQMAFPIAGADGIRP